MDASGNITPQETRNALRTLYRADRETNLQQAFLHALSDDLKPFNKRGGWNPGSLLVQVVLLCLAVAGVFFYFTIGRTRR
jgi:hypothetical protein